MELCSENHDEVCYESRRYPVCDVRFAFQVYQEDLEGSIEDLEKELNATKRRLDDCEAMLDERLENERSAEK
jgi:hypothetical protein